ncbi:ImmA/IrrE family metallo-endopeptidase [Solibacillus sp. MA9]|uniref:ImmA/IrrE family metallo-endopeptidase n=1 Tax=Solibacillus palustris TaxID=2908203 RepID=A0ABS9UCP9_9BACL|nr:ImmA/IrrE family metallo-endopeptidase [Solibacillus sp. MA9]MCH7321743.1 ImmA/IrrE family metallo-endopeptidase [Solibacillus sp. MA9]
MWIQKIVRQLTKKHQTTCPYEIAESCNILVFKHDLHHDINGYYKYDRRNQYIVINQNLSDHLQKVVCAHELGHAVLHKHVNTPLMRKDTFLLVSKIEREANRFAAELLIPDESINERESLQEIASIHNVPIELVELKCKKLFLQPKNEHIFSFRKE